MLDLKTINLIKKELSETDEITKKRIAAYSIFSKLEMPSQKSEAWRYSPVREINLDKFKMFGKEKTEIIVKKGKGVIACSLKEAFRNNREILMKYFQATLINNEDKLSAMHSAFWNTGVFIYVPKNTEAEIYLSISCEKEGVILPHNIIITEENSRLNYFEEHCSGKNVSCLRNEQTHVFAEKNSEVFFHSFQNRGDNSLNISNWKAELSKDSRIDWLFGQFGGKFSRVKIETLFNGQGSSSKTFGVFFGDREQVFDFTTDAYHNVPNTNCDILVKGVLDGSSNSVYRGKIKILKEAQQTNSFLSDHSLMLSEKAISNSIPSLEIDANDVKASHGATIGRPDEEEIFYLMTRGLGRKEAERLIITGYFSPVLEKIKNIEFREKFEKAIEEKKNV